VQAQNSLLPTFLKLPAAPSPAYILGVFFIDGTDFSPGIFLVSGVLQLSSDLFSFCSVPGFVLLDRVDVMTGVDVLLLLSGVLCITKQKLFLT